MTHDIITVAQSFPVQAIVGVCSFAAFMVVALVNRIFAV